MRVLDDTEEGRDSGSGSIGSSYKRRRAMGIVVLDEEVPLFNQAVAKGNAERNELESEHLALDHERLEAEKLEREISCAERHEDRKAAHELELQKLRVIMHVLQQVNGSTATGTEDAGT